MPSNSALRRTIAALLAGSLLLAGCSSADYLNRRDRITLAGGDAVRANLERETMNPSKGSMYHIGGLGADGGVIPAEAGTETAAAE
jgi:hypothetical protein